MVFRRCHPTEYRLPRRSAEMPLSRASCRTSSASRRMAMIMYGWRCTLIAGSVAEADVRGINQLHRNIALNRPDRSQAQDQSAVEARIAVHTGVFSSGRPSALTPERSIADANARSSTCAVCRPSSSMSDGWARTAYRRRPAWTQTG